MKIYPTTLTDLFYMSIHMRQSDKVAIIAQSDNDVNLERWVFERWLTTGPKFTGYDEKNMPVACGGIIIHRPGLGTAWFVARDDFKKYRKSIYAKVKSVVDTALAQKLVHRVQAQCVDCESAKEFLIKLGMEPEGKLRKIGRNGEDFFMYARVQ